MKRITEKQRELNIIGRAINNMGVLEDQWNDRILDYIYQHYPTQAVLSAETTSKEGIEERKRMKNDDVLKSMRAQMDKELKQADDNISN